MKIIEFAFVGYPITDVPRARAFYEKVLGFQAASVWEHEGRAWIEYEVGPHTLAITNMNMESWKPSADGASVALEVEDFDQAVEDLRAGGANIVQGPFDTPVCRMLIVCDPDGNGICIHKRNPGRDLEAEKNPQACC